MIRIAVCDDNAPELEHIYDMVLGFTKTVSGDFSIRLFRSPLELLDGIDRKGGFHIYLLDILMPNMNGIEVGEAIRKRDDLAVIIYLTSSKDYALKSFSVFAFQYLLKPVPAKELHGMLKKALSRIDQKTYKVITIKARDGVTALPYHQIIFVEYSNHSLRFYLSDGTTATSVSLREPFETTANELLKDHRFARPHVSFVVNMNHVKTINSKEFIMTNGSMVAISQKNYTQIKKKYIDFLLSQGDSTKC